MRSDADYIKSFEAIIFSSEKPMHTNDIKQYFPDIDDSKITALLNALKQDYTGRGIELYDNGGYWSFKTSPDVADILTTNIEVEKKLSRAAMETLAIIAYHQPLTRAEIENIRGVATGRGTLDILVESGWVKPGRRRETPGRPLTWVTTSGFLSHFNLESVTDLPGVDELKSAGLLDRRPSVQTLPSSGDLFNENEEE